MDATLDAITPVERRIEDLIRETTIIDEDLLARHRQLADRIYQLLDEAEFVCPNCGEPSITHHVDHDYGVDFHESFWTCDGCDEEFNTPTTHPDPEIVTEFDGLLQPLDEIEKVIRENEDAQVAIAQERGALELQRLTIVNQANALAKENGYVCPSCQSTDITLELSIDIEGAYYTHWLCNPCGFDFEYPRAQVTKNAKR